jgi:alpha-galactosidase
MTAEETAFTLVTGLAGRLYLSGPLDQLAVAQLALVHEATALYPQVIAHHAAAVPQWPLGLPAWDAPVVALASVAGEATLLAVWWRGGAEAVTLPFPAWAGQAVAMEPVFPRTLAPWPVTWDEAGALAIAPPATTPSARLFRLTPSG